MTGYDGLRNASAFLDLSRRGRIRVEGEDRARLLHAMSTNDVAQLAVGHGVYAFFLTAQGRILADAYVYNRGDYLLLDTEPEVREKLFEHLDKYIIADDVTLEDEAERLSVVALEGPTTFETAQKLGVPIPAGALDTVSYGTGFVAQVSSTGSQGLRIFLRTAETLTLNSLLHENGIPQATPEEARIVRLENGVPRYGEDISERYLVQETQQLSAVHFNKGCYLGQEIVERVRSRGQVHRLLTPVHIRATEAPVPGTKLSDAGKDVAEITSAAYSPALGLVVALAYVRAEALHSRPEMKIGSDPLSTAFIPAASVA